MQTDTQKKSFLISVHYNRRICQNIYKNKTNVPFLCFHRRYPNHSFVKLWRVVIVGIHLKIP